MVRRKVRVWKNRRDGHFQRYWHVFSRRYKNPLTKKDIEKFEELKKISEEKSLKFGTGMREFSDEELETMERMVKEGASLPEIGRAVHSSDKPIRRILREKGLR